MLLTLVCWINRLKITKIPVIMKIIILFCLLIITIFNVVKCFQIPTTTIKSYKTVIKMEKDMFAESNVGLKLQSGQVQRERYIASNRLLANVYVNVIINMFIIIILTQVQMPRRERTCIWEEMGGTNFKIIKIRWFSILVSSIIYSLL